MRRLLAATAVVVAFAAPASAAGPEPYDRTCGGAVDYECNGTVCPMDCFPGECLVWLDPFHSPFTALCVGRVDK